MKPIVHTLIALVFLAGSAFIVQSCTDGKANNPALPKITDPIPVKVIDLQKSTDATIINASGQITTDDETTLSFKTGGIVNAVYVKEGDAVKKGQLLATLDLTEINASVSQAKLAYDKAVRDFQRASNLYKDSVATLEQLQNAETGVAVAKEQLQAASFNLNYSKIYAPASGYVIRKFVNAGQLVRPGDAIVLTNGALSNQWILKVGVSDKQWSLIKSQNKVSVKVDAFPGQELEGTVIRKAETADPVTGTFSIDIQIKNAKGLASGMFGTAEIYSGESASSWSVPFEAVLDANDEEGYVFVTNDNKTAVKTPVVIESFTGDHIRISKGLEGSKAIIVTGSAYLSDKSPITVLK